MSIEGFVALDVRVSATAATVLWERARANGVSAHLYAAVWVEALAASIAAGDLSGMTLVDEEKRLFADARLRGREMLRELALRSNAASRGGNVGVSE